MKQKAFKFIILIFALCLCTSVFAITIESKKQEIDLDNNKGFFEGDVKVQVGDVVVTSPKANLDTEPATKKPSLATFLEKPYAYQIKGSKKHEIKADIIKVSLINKIITAEGSAQSNVIDNVDPLIIVTADMQEYDTKTNLMKAVGSVVINYEDMVATSDNAYALLDKTGDLKNLKLSSKALIKQDKSIIKGDNIQYSKLKQDIVVSGNTLSDVTFENGDRVIIYARSQQYDRKANVMMAIGDVNVKYGKYDARGPKAIMYVNSSTNKPEKIVFLGRSKIVENNLNSVEADKITLTMQPQTFEAVGNVKTNIEQKTNNTKDEMEFSL